MRKPLVILLVAAALLALAWNAYSNIKQARREASYRSAMAPFVDDLRLGMARADVETYLDSRRIPYHRVLDGVAAVHTDEIEIAEEPDTLVCSKWIIYLALEFDVANRLRDIHLRKDGRCL